MSGSNSHKGPSQMRKLLLVAGITMMIRVVWLLVVGAHGQEGAHQLYDSQAYQHFAQVLVEDGRLGYLESGTGEFYPMHNFTPGYPMFIAMFQAMGLGGMMLMIAQIMLACWTAVMTFKLTRLFDLGVKTGIVAAILIAIDLPSMVFGSMIMAETLFTALLMTGLWLFIDYLKMPAKWPMAMGAGMFLGMAVLVRPVGLFLLVVLLMVALWELRRIKFWRLGAIMLMMGFAMPVGPWMMRNHTTLGSPVVSTVGNSNLYWYRASAVVAERDGLSRAEVYDQFNEQDQLLRAKYKGDPVTYSRMLRNEGIRELKSAPGITLKLHALGAARLLLAPTRAPIQKQLVGSVPNQVAENPWDFGALGGLTTALVGWQLIVLPLIWIFFLWGAVRLWRERTRLPVVFVMAVILYFVMVSSGPETDARFRIPFFPLIAMFAAYGWTRWRESRKTSSPPETA